MQRLFLSNNTAQYLKESENLRHLKFFKHAKVWSTFLYSAPEFRKSLVVMGAGSEMPVGELACSWDFEKW
jgi:hypothetical protein